MVTDGDMGVIMELITVMEDGTLVGILGTETIGDGIMDGMEMDGDMETHITVATMVVITGMDMDIIMFIIVVEEVEAVIAQTEVAEILHLTATV